MSKDKSGKKKKNSPGGQGNLFVMKPPGNLNQRAIVINTRWSEYPLIDEVAKDVMGWRVSK
jgi:hypothetical protein